MSRRLQQPADLDTVEGRTDVLARALATLCSDIALLVDADGIVTDVAQGEGAPVDAVAEHWVGRPWARTVAGDSRRKIENLLADAGASGLGRRREVNHASNLGADLPVAYAALRLGERGPLLAVGRDLRSVASIQQCFLDGQQALERSYWHARHQQARRRLLHQAAMDAVVTVDIGTGCLVDLNAAAVRLLHAGAQAGQPVMRCFDARSQPAVASLLAAARAGGHAVERHLRLAGSHAAVQVAAARLSAGAGSRLLLRLRRPESLPGGASESGSSPALRVDDAAEGIVVIDAEGRIRDANPAFARIVQAADLADLLGASLSRWLPPECQWLVEHARCAGITPERRTSARRHDGALVPVLLAGALLSDVDGGCAGFTLRPLGAHPQAGLARPTPDDTAAGLGREALPDLVRRVQLQARAQLVHTALDRSGGDAPAAARLLGIGPELLARLQRELDLPPAPR